MKKRRRRKRLSGPIIAFTTLSLTVIGFLGLYTFLLNGGGLPGFMAAPTVTPTPVPSPTPTPDLSPKPIDITAHDGTRLKATFYPSPHPAETHPTLLLLHMAYGNRKQWQDFAKKAQTTGYVVLAPDLRGHGDSAGEKQFDLVMDGDIDAALTWLKKRPEVDPDQIGIFGASVGANLALRAAANHPEIKTLALLSPGLKLWNLGVDDTMAQYGRRAVLIVVSEDDKYPAGSATTLDEQAQGNHKLHIYAGADHGTDMFNTHPDLQLMLLDWLHETLPLARAGSAGALSGPIIGPIMATTGSDPNNPSPPQLYEKIEFTFDVTTTAKNVQWPYDAVPPPGIEPGLGITVNALFTPDNWKTIYTQPAFYYQEFQHDIKKGQDWIYPTGNYTWKVRFTPTKPGEWQFKLVAQDASGTTETPPQLFTVEPSDNKGFVRVSQKDPRYFEFDNGELFLGLGYNLAFNQPSWTNPTTATEPDFQTLHSYGLHFFRTWLSQWGIFTSAWNPWNAQNSDLHSQYIPYAGMTFEEAWPQSDVSMVVNANYNPCMFIGAWKAKPAVERNRTYRVRIRYKTKNIDGPRLPGQPFGFVAKTGGWLWGQDNYCYDPGVGHVVTTFQPQNTSDWQILEGKITTGQDDFLPNFYLVMENVNAGQAFVDYVWIEEDLGNGRYGPNIVSKPWMAHHQYFEQRNSYAFDQVLELAEKYNIYLKLVILEKNEWIFNHIDFGGNPIPDDPACRDDDKNNDPEECPGNGWFYGNWRKPTKTRWLQQAWWRYLQARWGYSPNIHSWELLNEGDPWNGAHYTLADEFGKYMHQFAPNDHLVTTSFWHSFPGDEFWANTEYPHVDYADLHAYAEDSEDTATNSALYSEKYGALQPEGANKPVVRGETGFSDDVLQDKAGVWLHNYIWAGVNPGGMYELYWYSQKHIVQAEQDNDLRYHFTAFSHFMADIPLNNGNYQDIQAVTSSKDFRAWGQKDAIDGCAHLWVQNKRHTWKNVVANSNIEPVSGTISLSGFQPGQEYTLSWWDTYQPDKTRQIVKTDSVFAEDDGSLTIPVDQLVTDVALKITSQRGCAGGN